MLTDYARRSPATEREREARAERRSTSTLNSRQPAPLSSFGCGGAALRRSGRTLGLDVAVKTAQRLGVLLVEVAGCGSRGRPSTWRSGSPHASHRGRSHEHRSHQEAPSLERCVVRNTAAARGARARSPRRDRSAALHCGRSSSRRRRPVVFATAGTRPVWCAQGQASVTAEAAPQPGADDALYVPRDATTRFAEPGLRPGRAVRGVAKRYPLQFVSFKSCSGPGCTSRRAQAPKTLNLLLSRSRAGASCRVTFSAPGNWTSWRRTSMRLCGEATCTSTCPRPLGCSWSTPTRSPGAGVIVREDDVV